jgi:hypothetical protein
MAIKGIAANIPIKGVDFVEYYYTSKTNQLNQTTHTVTVVLNKHIYGGKFSDTTEANAFNKAKELVKGCLVKSGCFKPDTRIDNIKFKKYNFPTIPLVPDFQPNSVDWTDVIHNWEEAPISTCAQITGINTPITLKITKSGDPGIVYYKVSNTNIGTSDYYVDSESWLIIEHNQTFVVENNQYVAFIVFLDMLPSQMSLGVVNVTDNNQVLDTFLFEGYNSPI